MSICKGCRRPLPDGANYCPRCGRAVAKLPGAKARGNGQGSAFKRGRSWTAVIVTGYSIGTDGLLHKHTRSRGGFASKREALAYLPELRVQAQTQAQQAQQITWTDIYNAWEPTHRAGRDTLNCYRAANKYFSPVWAEPLAEIDVDDLQACLDDCPHGKRTKQNMKALAGLLYKYAIPRHKAELNLAPYLIVTGADGEAREAIPLEDLRTLLACVGAVPGADYVAAQCFLGFRPSELLALDVRSYSRKERAFVGGAKTEAGRDRTVTVPPQIQPIIDLLTAGKITGPVFCGPHGEQLSIARYRRIFYEALDRCGIDNPVGEDGRHRYTPHSCRHTYATLLKRAVGSDKDKLELMGHTSTEMLRHYQDVELEDLRRITDALRA